MYEKIVIVLTECPLSFQMMTVWPGGGGGGPAPVGVP